MEQIANYIGMLGVIIVLIAYFLLQSGKLGTRHVSYSVMNFVASLMILYSLLFAWNLPAFIVEAVWAIVSLFGIIKTMLKQRKFRKSG